MNNSDISLRDFYKGKKVLITGHTGFKGSWLSEIMLQFGANVVGYALPARSKHSFFDALNIGKRIKKHYIGRIEDLEGLKQVLKEEQPEIVFHLAAQPIVKISYEEPAETIGTNVMGTVNILEAVRHTPSVKSVVIITTDKVYENKEWEYPYRESDTLGGYDPYSAGKAAADIITRGYIKSFFNPKDYPEKTKTLIGVVRAGNVIGGGDWAPYRLIPDIARFVLEENKPVLLRNPNAVRPWQHVLEPLAGYMMLGQKLYNGDTRFVDAFNFGPHNSGCLTTKEIVDIAISVMNEGSVVVETDPNAVHEAGLLKLDISKTSQMLKWNPRFGIDKHLEFTFDWYRTYYRDIGNISKVTTIQINQYFE